MELEINRTRRLNNLQFYPQANKKTMIFWHHTAGMTADGAIRWWDQTPEHVGTAYVIERDGTIMEVFDPKLWAYHLGIKGDDDYAEKNSIGIEIVSGGWLIKENDAFMFYPLYPNKAGGKKIDPKEVWDMGEGKEWRGHRYYHAYTQKQIDSLFALTKKLAADFQIPIQKDLTGFYEFKPELCTKQHLPGIWSHSTVLEGKSDIIPHPDFLKQVYLAFKETSTKK